MTIAPIQEPKGGHNEILDQIKADLLEDLLRRKMLYTELCKRVMDVMMLNEALVAFRDLGGKMKSIATQRQIGSPILLSPAVSGEALAVFQLGKALLSILDGILRPEDEFQRVAGLRPDEIDAIDLNQASLPYIVPRDPNKTGPQVTVRLSDIDEFRLEEARRLAQFLYDDSGVIDKGATEIVHILMGGYRTDAIFPKNPV